MEPPLGQLGVPCVQRTEMLPVVMSWNTFATFARPYNVGPTLPMPTFGVPPSFCSTSARIPAKVGATKEGRPKTLGCPEDVRKPLLQGRSLLLDPEVQTI